MTSRKVIRSTTDKEKELAYNASNSSLLTS
jgi:hypothetical protein